MDNGFQKGVESFHIQSGHDELTITLGMTLDIEIVSKLWVEFDEVLKKNSQVPVLINANSLLDCHTIGIAFLYHCKQRAESYGLKFRIEGLNSKFLNLLESLGGIDFQVKSQGETLSPKNKVEKLGQGFLENLIGFEKTIEFFGEVFASFILFAKHPYKNLRWKEVFYHFEKSGADAFPLVALIGFLFGLIISFQSSIPMQRFGAEVFIANLVSLSLFRELGPLLTAIILAARSASSYAAEIGTMKVSEELDALHTMGLDPVPFLILPRLVAGILLSPILTLFLILFGLIGSSLVVMNLGFSFSAFVGQAKSAVRYIDLIGGLVKAGFFGFLVSIIGSLAGIQTKDGASAVGVSTTRAVVMSILSIAISDGIFSLIYYVLEI